MSELRQLNLDAADLAIVMRILQARVPDRDVYAFGSRVNGTARHRSDLDLAIEGTLTLRQRAELAEDFSESDLPIAVDFIDFHVLTPVFRRRIEQEWLPLLQGTKTVESERVAA